MSVQRAICAIFLANLHVTGVAPMPNGPIRKEPQDYQGFRGFKEISELSPNTNSSALSQSDFREYLNLSQYLQGFD